MSACLYRYKWLFLCLVERCVEVFALGEVDFVKVDAPYGAVIHRAVIYHLVGHVGRRCPLCGTRYVGMYFSRRELNTYRYVEVVEYLESLSYCTGCCGLFGSCGLEEGSTYKP